LATPAKLFTSPNIPSYINLRPGYL